MTIKPLATSRQFKITSEYGTFAISKTVTIWGDTSWTEDQFMDEAFVHTGIMTDLIDAGWTVDVWPEGEEHTVKGENASTTVTT